MKGPALGETVLDRVHQAMILFAAGRSEAVKRFLVEDGAGTDARFWKLAQSLSALYPKDTDEKRWVDGVLAQEERAGAVTKYLHFSYRGTMTSCAVPVLRRWWLMIG